jgi:hypothetical protein
MSDVSTNTYRIITLNGLTVDFQSKNSIEALWVLIRGEGYFQRQEHGRIAQRIPFHAIASMEIIDPQRTAVYAPAASEARN